MKVRAMILAAGRGQRMRPLTDTIPKPLLELHGKPLITGRIEALAAAGFHELVINLGWLGEQIEALLGDGQAWAVSITYSREPPGALETAGGIRHALPLLGADPFLVINADVICDYPLQRLRGTIPEGLAHLVMVENPTHHPGGDFSLDGDRLRLGGQSPLTYSGIGVFRPEMFTYLPEGVRPLRPVLEDAIARDEVTAELHAGQWVDIGTPQRLRELDRG